jgi:ElaB/YqjD/DUF883 family membrane-anchored ribosome-binding protein
MKAKPIIIIVITLVIGFVLGMLVSGRIRYHRLKPVRVFFSEERFREGFYNVIQPDEKQKEKIDLLLSKYATINGDMQNDFRKKLDSVMKEYWKELEPNLTKDQLDRLKQMDQRRMEMIRQNRRNPHNDSLNFRNDRRMPPPPGEKPPFHKHDTDRLKDNKQ